MAAGRGVSGATLGLAATIWLLAALLLFSREPGHLMHPQLWAEDGVLWLREAYVSGFSCLADPVAGYFQTLSRLAGLLAAKLPLTLAPALFAGIAFLFQLLPVLLLLSPRGRKWVPSLTFRLLLALYYVGEPNSSEVYVNLTNAMWHLALAVFLLLVMPKPTSRIGLVLDVILLLLSSVSGPLVLFLVPIAWWNWLTQRREASARLNALYAAVLSLGALVQGSVVAAHMAGERFTNLGATIPRLAHILADQIFLGGILGAHLVLRLMDHAWWMRPWPALLVCGLAFAAIGRVFLKGPATYQQFAVFSALIVMAALKSPMISATEPQWPLMQFPGIGGRYFIIPILAWFVTLLLLSADNGWWRWLARCAVIGCVIGVVADWCYAPYTETGYDQQAKMFDQAPPGTTVIFRENPIPWQFQLTKH